jgi:hypothetical protein
MNFPMPVTLSIRNVPADLVAAARAAGISSRGDSTALIRRMRDERHR